MRFRRHLTTRLRLDNLRRLTCPAPVYLYLLDRYARLIHTDADTVQFKGVLMRLFFENRQRLKRRMKSRIRRERSRSGAVGRGTAPGQTDTPGNAPAEQ